MNYIIYDLEATCWAGKIRELEQEIIEIGAFMLNHFGEVTGTYNRFVRPFLHPYLSPFCTSLTSITQEDVNRAGKFPEIIEEFQDWAKIYEEEYLLCSWGSFDRKMLVKDCKLYQLESEWAENHFNIKSQYQEMKKLRRPCGLKSAVIKEGFEFTGIHHRGISDAENLAKIFGKYIDDWQF